MLTVDDVVWDGQPGQRPRGGVGDLDLETALEAGRLYINKNVTLSSGMTVRQRAREAQQAQQEEGALHRVRRQQEWNAVGKLSHAAAGRFGTLNGSGEQCAASGGGTPLPQDKGARDLCRIRRRFGIERAGARA